MRIISGKFKKKRIFFSKNLITRPLKDNVRESIFNVLEHSTDFNVKIKSSFILDLYAGVGSFGLESISRGAEHVCFVESNKEALLNLKKNIDLLKINTQINMSSLNVLNFIENYKENRKFDILFLDPPFKNTDYLDILEIIKKNEILNNKHLIILHREKKSLTNFNENLKILDSKLYNRSEIFFLRFS